jgi:hypothetical protein
MGFFTDEEHASAKIKKMIMHVVGGKTFIAMPQRKPEHVDFFLGKILETAADAVFTFKAASSTRAEIEEIASAKKTFERGAQSLALSFNQKHVSGSADGVLFMFELEVEDPSVVIYSFIKYDYKMALEQDGSNPGNSLREIVTALIDDKKAIQKTAVVRVVNGVAEPSVSARDRTKQAPDIAVYFADFLAVTRTISNEDLSKITRDLLRRTLQACKADLPDQDIPRATKIAQGILGRRLKIDEEAIVEAVLIGAGDPSDEKVKHRLERETRTRVKKSKLHELEFKPDRKVLRQPHMRKIITAEGVTVMFTDTDNNPNVKIVNTGGDSRQIIIETKLITENSLVSPPPGQRP